MSTDLYVLLDASGSMGGREQEVVNHFNEYLTKHKSEAEATFISLALFDSNRFHWVYQWKPIADARPLTLEDYTTGSNTPLNDSVGKVLDVAAANPDTGKLVIIITDGQENASLTYPGVGNADLKARIAALDTKQWGVVYIGENVNAAAVAASINVSAGNAKSVKSIAASLAVADVATNNYMHNRRSGQQQVNLTSSSPKRKTD